MTADATAERFYQQCRWRVTVPIAADGWALDAADSLWRFDRERSTRDTRDCQAEVCQACGLVRLTSYRTGQVVRYEGAGAGDGA